MGRKHVPINLLALEDSLVAHQKNEKAILPIKKIAVVGEKSLDSLSGIHLKIPFHYRINSKQLAVSYFCQSEYDAKSWVKKD